MPTYNIEFNVPSDAVPKVVKLFERENIARESVGAEPFENVEAMVVDILRNRLKLMVAKAERSDIPDLVAQLRSADDATLDEIRAIFTP